MKMWTDLHTLPDTNPLRRNTARIKKFRRFHRSPLYQVADALKNIEMETLETINPFTLAPWEARMQTDGEAMPDPQSVPGGSIQIAISSRIWGGDREAATSISKIETEGLLRNIGRKIRAESILRRASGYSTYVEQAGGTEGFQAQVAHKQQSGGPHDTEPSTTVRPGVRLPDVQVGKQTAEKRKPFQASLGPGQRRQQITGPS